MSKIPTGTFYVRKKSTTFASLLLIIVVIALYYVFPEKSDLSTKNDPTPSQEEILQPSSRQAKVKQSAARHQIADIDLTDPPRFEKIVVEDIKSVDGDTFAFRSRGKTFKLRLLMVDTPESVKVDTPVMPFGKEASEYTAKQLEKKTVSLVFDKGAVKDKYNRYLAYVYVGEDLLQNLLLENGLGIVRYVNSGGDSYLKELLAAQQIAKEQKIGVWSLKDYVYETETSYFRYNDKIKAPS